MNYVAFYNEMVHSILERPLTPEDGVLVVQIEVAERRLGMLLPLALREYYRVAGNLDEINANHNQLRSLGDLEFEDEYLIFMDENQGVMVWAINTKDEREDPEVWQRVLASPGQWYSEKATFSHFLHEMFTWTFGLDEDLGMPSP